MRYRTFLPQKERRATGILLWVGAAVFVCCAHVAFAWVTFLSPPRPPKMGEPAGAVMVELAPTPSVRTPETGAAVAASGRVSDAVDTLSPHDKVSDTPPTPAPMPRPVAGSVPLPSRPPESRPTRTAAAKRTEAKPLAEAPQETAAASNAATSSALPQMVDASASVSDLPSDWKSRLLSHLNRYKRYPAGARSEGVTLISFSMDRQGQLLGFSVARSSGDPALDAEAWAMVQRAVPLPAFPPEIMANTLQLTVPVRFTVR